MPNQTSITIDLTSATLSSVGDLYAPKVSPTLTGTVDISGATSVSLPTNTSIGSVSLTEVGYLDGVTSNIQTQINDISLSGGVSGNIILPRYVANSAGAVVFEGSTADNNQLFLIPTDPGSDVYLTLPAITDTLVTKTTTDTFTNKTFNTSGTGNVFQINGTTLSATTGTGSTAVLNTSPTINTSIVTGANFTLAVAATTLSIGGTTLGTTTNIQGGVTASAVTKTINVGTGGLSGSITNITLGSSTTGATGTTKIYTGLSLVTPQAPITATTYTISTTDSFLIFNTTATCTVTMPLASSYPGRIIWMKQIAAFAVNASATSIQPLDNVTPGTSILSGAGKFAQIVSNANNWIVVSAN